MTNRVKPAEVTGSRIFPQKNVVTMATMTAPTPKNDCRLCFTITHLHAKFEDDPRRTAAGRALTSKSLRRRTRRRDDAKSILSLRTLFGGYN